MWEYKIAVMHQAWEHVGHCTELYPNRSARTTLNNLGSDGWELVSVTIEDDDDVIAYFKRRRDEEE